MLPSYKKEHDALKRSRTCGIIAAVSLGWSLLETLPFGVLIVQIKHGDECVLGSICYSLVLVSLAYTW